ncbi:anoctamin-like protein Os01g0706700 isoform X3 [Physcomitrium patens]|uniref:anoctamin-like protein Os01g0706700 isoform X3 n=1 Tax=Physcomitrium patens TaxID=3218 RepID=UPI003CCCA8C2
MEEAFRKEDFDVGVKSMEMRQTPPFEIAIVIDSKNLESKSHEFGGDVVGHLITELSNAGLIVEKVDGANFLTFLKIGAPVDVIGREASRLKLRKPTNVGLDVVFDWERRDSFVRQPLGDALFSWTERYQCIISIIDSVYGPDNVPLVKKLQDGGVIKEVMALHQEQQRQWLLKHWALRFMDLTRQPLDVLSAYFGAKVAIYFAFLGMYTRWLLFPAALGIFLHFTDQGPMEPAVPPIYAMIVVIWAVVFLQFWRRQNAALQNKWGLSYESEEIQTIKSLTREQRGVLLQKTSQQQAYGANVSEQEAQILGREEWLSRIRSVKNSMIAVTCILCVQFPFELLYAHLNKYAPNDIIKYIFTGVYLLIVQYLTKIGGQVGIALTKSEHLVSKEAAANSMIYKVFGLYFFQSYIGLFYQAILHKDFNTLRSMLAQRLIVSQLMSNVVEDLIPYMTYRWTEYKAMKADAQIKKDMGEKPHDSHDTHSLSVEKEFYSPKYEASVGNEFEDGLFDDFLELAVQFGMVTMFASAYPLVAMFAFMNNLVEIRSDALKLLVTMRRPAPRRPASIGAWLTIFQNLGVVAIVTNCALLVCLYDDAGRWKIEPGLAAILLLEHLLLLAKFGFSWFVPEEPAWIKARRIKKAFIQDHVSHRLLEMLEKNTEDEILHDIQNPMLVNTNTLLKDNEK